MDDPSNYESRIISQLQANGPMRSAVLAKVLGTNILDTRYQRAVKALRDSERVALRDGWLKYLDVFIMSRAEFENEDEPTPPAETAQEAPGDAQDPGHVDVAVESETVDPPPGGWTAPAMRDWLGGYLRLHGPMRPKDLRRILDPSRKDRRIYDMLNNGLQYLRRDGSAESVDGVWRWKLSPKVRESIRMGVQKAIDANAPLGGYLRYRLALPNVSALPNGGGDTNGEPASPASARVPLLDPASIAAALELMNPDTGVDHASEPSRAGFIRLRTDYRMYRDIPGKVAEKLLDYLGHLVAAAGEGSPADYSDAIQEVADTLLGIEAARLRAAERLTVKGREFGE